MPVLPHIETSQLISYANQLTDFYMRATLAGNRLITIFVNSLYTNEELIKEWSRDFA